MQIRAEAELSEFMKQSTKQAKQFPRKQFKNTILKRKLEKLSIDGVNALSEGKTKQVKITLAKNSFQREVIR